MSKNFRSAQFFMGLGLAAALFAGCASAPPAPSASPKPTTPSPVASAAPTMAPSAAPTETAAPAGSETPGMEETPAEGETPAGGETPSAEEDTPLSHAEAGVTFTVPAGWKHEEVNGHMMVAPPDSSVVVIFNVPAEQDFEKAGKEVDALLASMISDVKVNGEGKEGEHNGMKSFSIEGTGKYEGKDCDWSVDLVKANKILMVIGVGEKAGIEANAEGLTKLFGSLKPL